MSDSGEHAAGEPVHGGHHAVDAAIECGAQALFTLSGAHIFPLFDAAVGGADAVRSADSTQSAERGGRLPLLDVRHEQTAVFAAEAVGKLSRVPGFAAVTAGPGVTNALSAVTGAWMNGSPLVLVGGRAPDYRWGSGALQELDHVPLLAPVTKSATTVQMRPKSVPPSTRLSAPPAHLTAAPRSSIFRWTSSSLRRHRRRHQAPMP